MRTMLCVGGLAMMTAAAAADQCENMINRIDQLVVTSAIDQQSKNTVLAMRERALNAHIDLDHPGAIQTARDALVILNSQ